MRQGWVYGASWDKEIAAGLDSAYHDKDYQDTCLLYFCSYTSIFEK